MTNETIRNEPENNKKTIFLDFDGVISDTIWNIVDLYNSDFKYYKDFEHIYPSDIKTWDFEECKLATKEQINQYFNQSRFFKNIQFMPYFYRVYDLLLQLGYHIKIVSHGYSPNLKGKEEFIKTQLPDAEFIPVNLKEYKDKSCVDMSGSIFIDDSAKNLETSNAEVKVCFGEVYPWNQDWEGIRCNNWLDVWRQILGGRI